MGNVVSWIANDSRMAKFLSEHCGESASANSELEALVELRNDAAHGIPYTLPSITGMRCLCDLVSILCTSLHDFAVKEMLMTRQSAKRAEQISYAKELFMDGRVAVGDFEKVTMAVGAVLYFVTDHACSTVTVESIQVDGVAKNSVEVSACIELGLRLNAAVKKNARIYRLVDPP
jgi:hypothetical protein